MRPIKILKWRYATKKFDPSKKVSPEHLQQLKKSIQLSPSSYGLQLYKVIIIEDAQLKEQLKSASFNQSQITDASHLIVFCNYTKISTHDIDQYFTLKTQTEQIDAKSFEGYSDFIKADVLNKPTDHIQKWTSNQTYIALSNLLNICAEMKIDTCPMEGFETEKYNDILNLNTQNLNVSVIATIGYRSIDDGSQHSKKVRKPLDDLFIEYQQS